MGAVHGRIFVIPDARDQRGATVTGSWQNGDQARVNVKLPGHPRGKETLELVKEDANVQKKGPSVVASRPDRDFSRATAAPPCYLPSRYLVAISVYILGVRI